MLQFLISLLFCVHCFTESTPQRAQFVTKAQALADVDQLETLLKNNFSYLHWKNVDLDAGIEKTRQFVLHSSDLNISVKKLAVQLMKLITLVGDGHSRVDKFRSRYIDERGLPFYIANVQDRVFAYKRKNLPLKGFEALDLEHPFIQKIDGVTLEEWESLITQIVPSGSDSMWNEDVLTYLRYIQFLRELKEIDKTNTLKVTLVNFDKSSFIEKEYPVYRKTRKLIAPLFRDEAGRLHNPVSVKKVLHKRLEGNVGYIFMPMHLGACKKKEREETCEITESLHNAMGSLRNTTALIIDLRISTGGKRELLKHIFPYFLEKKAKPRVLNATRSLLSVVEKNDFSKAIEGRGLFLESSDHWSEKEKKAISDFKGVFLPRWSPPQIERFEPWRYFVLGPSKDIKRYFYYEKPVAILSSRTNFSAADIFLSAFKELRDNIKIVGTPSSGGSGMAAGYKLNHSRIEVELSSFISYQKDGNLFDGHGVQPDVLVEPTIDDYLYKTDSVLDKAIELVKSL